MMLLERLLIVHMPQMTQSLLDTKTDPFVALPPGEIRPPCKLIDRTHHVTEKVTQVSRDLIKLLYISLFQFRFFYCVYRYRTNGGKLKWKSIKLQELANKCNYLPTSM